jgi:Spy/CpxP family protein refolding chaperone
MKMQFLTIAAAAFMAAPMLHAQAVPAPTRPPTSANAAKHAGPRRGHDRMMKDLGLTADQKARMKALHTKYASQMKSAREASKPDFEAMKAARTRGDTAAMRAARARLRSAMAPSQKVRQQEMAEMRGVLTPAQQQKFDAQRAQMKANMGKNRAKKGHGGWTGKRPANAVQPASYTR